MKNKHPLFTLEFALKLSTLMLEFRLAVKKAEEAESRFESTVGGDRQQMYRDMENAKNRAKELRGYLINTVLDTPMNEVWEMKKNEGG